MKNRMAYPVRLRRNMSDKISVAFQFSMDDRGCQAISSDLRDALIGQKNTYSGHSGLITIRRSVSGPRGSDVHTTTFGLIKAYFR